MGVCLSQRIDWTTFQTEDCEDAGRAWLLLSAPDSNSRPGLGFENNVNRHYSSPFLHQLFDSLVGGKSHWNPWLIVCSRKLFFHSLHLIFYMMFWKKYKQQWSDLASDFTSSEQWATVEKFVKIFDKWGFHIVWTRTHVKYIKDVKI